MLHWGGGLFECSLLRELDRRKRKGLWPSGLGKDSGMPWWQNQHLPQGQQGVGKEGGSGLRIPAVEIRLTSDLGQVTPF